MASLNLDGLVALEGRLATMCATSDKLDDPGLQAEARALVRRRTRPTDDLLLFGAYRRRETLDPCRGDPCCLGDLVDRPAAAQPRLDLAHGKRALESTAVIDAGTRTRDGSVADKVGRYLLIASAAILAATAAWTLMRRLFPPLL